MPARSVRIAAATAAIALASSIGLTTSAAAAPAGDGDAHPTLFGASVIGSDGGTYEEALALADKQFGNLDVVRYFDPDLPNDWNRIRDNTGDRPLVVSFNAPPQEVLAGRHDDALRQWFKTAPKSPRSWWSYLPEPEEPSENGEFTPEQFRRAWAHIENIADQVAPKNFKSALVLMTYTLSPYSERNWRHYYPGDEHVDLMAWDGYNVAAGEGRYDSPKKLYDEAVKLSRSVGKPWAIAETGSELTASDDDGSERAKWLHHLGRYAERRDAKFVTYFNADYDGEYRLDDRASQQAWRDVVDLAPERDGTSDSAGKALGDSQSGADSVPQSSGLDFAGLVQRLLTFFRSWLQIF